MGIGAVERREYRELESIRGRVEVDAIGRSPRGLSRDCEPDVAGRVDDYDLRLEKVERELELGVRFVLDEFGHDAYRPPKKDLALVCAHEHRYPWLGES